MKKPILKYAAIAMSAFMLYSCQQEEDEIKNITPEVTVASASNMVPGSYIVVFNTDKTGHAGRKFQGDYAKATTFVREQATDMLRDHNISGELTQVYSQTINGVAMKITEAEVAKLQSDSRVAYIEQDQIISLGVNSSAVSAAAVQETPWGITRVNGVANYTGSNTAWIIDSGIDLDHPDLNVDVNRSASFLSGGGPGASSPNDENGHGTHVAGTIAALNNNIGVIGVAPGASVVSVRVLDRRGSGTYSGVIAGVDYVGANGANGDVANMSLGGGASQSLDDAVVAASSGGVIFAIAAGNDGADANNYSPARANGPNIVTISAMSQGDNWASFSNYGNPPVDYCAPGVSILSTWKDGGYNTISGTSMATPHAAGVLLLGNASTSGTVIGDPDGNPDPIIVH